MALAVPVVALLLLLWGGPWLTVLTGSAVCQCLFALAVVRSEAGARVALTAIGAAAAQFLVDALTQQRGSGAEVFALGGNLGLVVAMLSALCMALGTLLWLVGSGADLGFATSSLAFAAGGDMVPGATARCPVVAQVTDVHDGGAVQALGAASVSAPPAGPLPAQDRMVQGDPLDTSAMKSQQ